MHGLIADFIHYLDVERGLASTTQISYQQDLMSFQAWLTSQKRTTFPEDFVVIQAFLKKQNDTKAPASVSRMISALRKFYRFLLREGAQKSTRLWPNRILRNHLACVIAPFLN